MSLSPPAAFAREAFQGSARGLPAAVGAVAGDRPDRGRAAIALRPARRRLLADHRRREVARRRRPPIATSSRSTRPPRCFSIGPRSPWRAASASGRSSPSPPSASFASPPVSASARRSFGRAGLLGRVGAARSRRGAGRVRGPAGPIVLRARSSGGALRPAFPRDRGRARGARAGRLRGSRSWRARRRR